MSPVRTVLGARLQVDDDGLNETVLEDTPQSFRLEQLKVEVERRRLHDSELSKRVEKLESKVSLATFISSSLGAVSVVVAAVLGYFAVMAPSRVTARVITVATDTTESILRQRQPTVQQQSLDTAREALRLDRLERESSANPTPIQRGPERVAGARR
jgi:hypothetical protein